MKARHFTLLSALALGLSSLGFSSYLALNKPAIVTHASPTSGTVKNANKIDLNACSTSDVRSYYSSLSSLSASERTGQNLLKNLKPILQNFTYYSYDAVWKIYEITDRDWDLSPAGENEASSTVYDSVTNTYTYYVYGNSGSNPYVHALYRNPGDTSGLVRAYGDHDQTGINREHVWCQSRGFKKTGSSSGANGPAGTDVHHLIAGDGRVNQTEHNNNPYGNVQTISSNAVNYKSYLAGNVCGSPKTTSSLDKGSVVFEPQDCDKGDIARAIFYMVACYNNIANETGVISTYNPNLALVDYVSSTDTEYSSDSTAVTMGILSDLLEWHRLDPVDDYEIHRNDLIYKNFQHNRNPFIDFPDWVDVIWGDEEGVYAGNPSNDLVYNTDPSKADMEEVNPTPSSSSSSSSSSEDTSSDTSTSSTGDSSSETSSDTSSGDTSITSSSQEDTSSDASTSSSSSSVSSSETSSSSSTTQSSEQSSSEIISSSSISSSQSSSSSGGGIIWDKSNVKTAIIIAASAGGLALVIAIVIIIIKKKH